MMFCRSEEECWLKENHIREHKPEVSEIFYYLHLLIYSKKEIIDEYE